MAAQSQFPHYVKHNSMADLMLFFKQPGDNHQIDYSNWLTHHSRSGGDTHETISPLYDVLSLFKVEKQRFMSS
jgi:hypothetical protein